MDHPLIVIAMMAMVGVLYVLAPVAADAYRRFRGARLITCPENREPAAVKLDVAHAALTAATIDNVELRLSSCSRWPERRDCGQACLRQIETAPEDCLVRTIVARWYENKRCMLCGKPIAVAESWANQPAMMGPDGQTLEWCDVEIPKLPETFRSHQPVCWNCHIAETFRRKYPELVIDAPPRSGRTLHGTRESPPARARMEP